MWDIGGDGFDNLGEEGVGMLEIANLSLDEPSLEVKCNGAGAIPPATLAEFNIPAGGGQDFYDVSLVDGFNLPMSVTPQGGTGDCNTATCPANVNAVSLLQKVKKTTRKQRRSK
ncbi:hypothetical protein L3X38_037902 [Prunus dulcis]|uniref:Pathogenesis-related thaumatin superfamily protein n=1 Tax=Prunus dulcis TaxID=3755 RepID=A0AAD4V4A6_PRUDU|nr:hypothetical protein L3X38_037902 [Prunus dulcis]